MNTRFIKLAGIILGVTAFVALNIGLHQIPAFHAWWMWSLTNPWMWLLGLAYGVANYAYLKRQARQMDRLLENAVYLPMFTEEDLETD